MRYRNLQVRQARVFYVRLQIARFFYATPFFILHQYSMKDKTCSEGGKWLLTSIKKKMLSRWKGVGRKNDLDLINLSQKGHRQSKVVSVDLSFAPCSGNYYSFIWNKNQLSKNLLQCATDVSHKSSRYEIPAWLCFIVLILIMSTWFPDRLLCNEWILSTIWLRHLTSYLYEVHYE